MRSQAVVRKKGRVAIPYFRLAALWLVALVGMSPAFVQNVAAAGSASDNQTVYPTGTFPADVDAVQAAVSRGGSILLKATNRQGDPTAFNFGPPDDANTSGGVYITKDVKVFGERRGPYQTKIDGGVIPFRGWMPGDTGDSHARVKTMISGLDFERPLLSAVTIDWSSGSQIVGNRIANVQGELVCADPDCNQPIGTEGRAIKFLGNYDPEHAITGKISVSDNEIVNSNADLSAAIVLDSVAADVTIQNNRITVSQEGGMFLIDSSGKVIIDDNFIAPGDGNGNASSLGNGIDILDINTAGAEYIVTHNTLDIENPGADGIILDGYGGINHAIVTNNQVTMHGTNYGAISLFQNVSDSRITGNIIRGNASFGLDIMEYAPESKASSNLFAGNNLKRFSGSVADIFLGENSQNTTVAERARTIIDLGVNNHTGAVHGGDRRVGQQIEHARARRRWEDTRIIMTK